MKTEINVQIADWFFSAALMVSVLIASIRKQRFDSWQYNIVNVITSCALSAIAFSLGIYGSGFRQACFAMISLWNLTRRIISERRLRKKENGRA